MAARKNDSDKQRKPRRRALTVKQQKFADGVVRTGNATQAAIEAGYSPESAKVIASQNLGKPEIAGRIAERIEALNSFTVNEGLGLLVRVQRGKAADLFDDDNNFIGMGEARKRGLDHLIKSLAVKRFVEDGRVVEVVKVETHCAVQVAQFLSKVLINGARRRSQEEERRRFYTQMVSDLAQKYDVPREKVMQDVIERRPEAAQYLLNIT